MSLANRMALASAQVTARAIEAEEFPEMSSRYGVEGVPRTVVNGRGAFVGAMPERQFVASVLKLAGVEPQAPEDGSQA